jgi:thiosulfate/3-mercaptopyruvate sulfurtransferase
MKRGMISIAAILLLFGLAGCEQSHPPVRDHLLVSTDWLADHLDDPSVVVVHVSRHKGPYLKGHIPGTRHLSWHDLTVTSDGVLNEFPPVDKLVATMRELGIDNDDRVIFYDHKVGIRAARAYYTMDYLGMGERAALLDGQLAKWKAEGRPVSTDVPQVKPGNFTANPRPEIVADIETVRQASAQLVTTGDSQTCLIDGRAPENYRGEKAGENVPRAGHVPGAANVYSHSNIVSDKNPVFRSPKELRKQYNLVGVSTRKQIITYCRTGGQASLNYFTLKYLGYDPMMYDGSFSHWSSRKDTTVMSGEKP